MQTFRFPCDDGLNVTLQCERNYDLKGNDFMGVKFDGPHFVVTLSRSTSRTFDLAKGNDFLDSGEGEGPIFTGRGDGVGERAAVDAVVSGNDG